MRASRRACRAWVPRSVGPSPGQGGTRRTPGFVEIGAGRPQGRQRAASSLHLTVPAVATGWTRNGSRRPTSLARPASWRSSPGPISLMLPFQSWARKATTAGRMSTAACCLPAGWLLARMHVAMSRAPRQMRTFVGSCRRPLSSPQRPHRPAHGRPDGVRRISVNFEGSNSGAEGLLSK